MVEIRKWSLRSQCVGNAVGLEDSEWSVRSDRSLGVSVVAALLAALAPVRNDRDEDHVDPACWLQGVDAIVMIN